MNSTQAIVIIADADKSQALADLTEGLFTVPLSADGNMPVTHWMSSGWFLNEQLDKICNEVAWPKTIRFGTEWQNAIDQAGLKVIENLE